MKKPSKNSKELFPGLKGERFGGGQNRLLIEVGQVAGPFHHVSVQDRDLGSGEVPIYLGADEDGVEISMPAAAIFRRAAENAKLNSGDQYHVQRLPDARKKSGKGKGKPMEVYAVLVTRRTKIK